MFFGGGRFEGRKRREKSVKTSTSLVKNSKLKTQTLFLKQKKQPASSARPAAAPRPPGTRPGRASGTGCPSRPEVSFSFLLLPPFSAGSRGRGFFLVENQNTHFLFPSLSSSNQAGSPLRKSRARTTRGLSWLGSSTAAGRTARRRPLLLLLLLLLRRRRRRR